MKYLNKLALLLIGCALVACTKNDPIDDIFKTGEFAPVTYWEIKSSNIAPGDSGRFKLQYYPLDGKGIDKIELWHDIQVKSERTIKCPIFTDINFSLSSDETELARMFQKAASYDHALSVKNENGIYILDGAFPVSSTLESTSWGNLETFDYRKFNQFFPAGSLETFRDSLFTLLKAEHFQKLMTVEHQIYTDAEFMDRVEFIHNANSGRDEMFIKDAYKQEIKDAYYNLIPMEALTYSSSEKTFNVKYTKKYTLNAQVKVIDTGGTAGITEKKTFDIQ